MCVGYFAGYFLLVFGVKPTGRLRFAPTSSPLVSNAAMGLVWILFLLAPVLLLSRNLPQIRKTNGPMLRQFVSLMANRLPAQGSIVLSDELGRLLLLQSALTQAGKSKDFLLLDTSSLRVPDYYDFLLRKYPEKWQTSVPKEAREVPDADIQYLLSKLAETNNIYYLHPSFGYYFEVVYSKPHGLVFRLQPNAPKVVERPPLTPGEIEQTEAAWEKLREELDSLARSVKRARTNKNVYANDVWAGMWYSRALNYWGVELQKRNELAKAATRLNGVWALAPGDAYPPGSLKFARSVSKPFGSLAA